MQDCYEALTYKYIIISGLLNRIFGRVPRLISSGVVLLSGVQNAEEAPWWLATAQRGVLTEEQANNTP